MKLYATVTSERDSRMVKKGANEFLRIELTAKNRRAGQIELRLMNDEKYAQITYYSKAGEVSIVSIVPMA